MQNITSQFYSKFYINFIKFLFLASLLGSPLGAFSPNLSKTHGHNDALDLINLRYSDLKGVLLSKEPLAHKKLAIEIFLVKEMVRNPHFDLETFLNFAPTLHDAALNTKIGSVNHSGNTLLHLVSNNWELMEFVLNLGKRIDPSGKIYVKFDPTGKKGLAIKNLYYLIYEKKNKAFKNLVNYIQRNHSTQEALNILNVTLMAVSPLHIALGEGNVECAKILIDAGVDINLAVQEDSIRPIHVAAARGDLEIFSYLLQQPSLELNVTTSRTKMTPLLFAAFRGNLEILRLLLSENYGDKIDINAQSSTGMTALTYALAEAKENPRSVEIIKLLLDHGSDIQIRDKNLNDGFIYGLHKDKLEAMKIIFMKPELLVGLNASKSLNGEYTSYLFHSSDLMAPFFVAADGIISNKSGESTGKIASFLLKQKVDKINALLNQLDNNKKDELLHYLNTEYGEHIKALLNEVELLKVNEKEIAGLSINEDTHLKENAPFNAMLALQDVLFSMDIQSLESLKTIETKDDIKGLFNQEHSQIIESLFARKSAEKNDELSNKIIEDFAMQWVLLPPVLKTQFLDLHLGWKNKHFEDIKFDEIFYAHLFENIFNYASNMRQIYKVIKSRLKSNNLKICDLTESKNLCISEELLPFLRAYLNCCHAKKLTNNYDFSALFTHNKNDTSFICDIYDPNLHL